MPQCDICTIDTAETQLYHDKNFCNGCVDFYQKMEIECLRTLVCKNSSGDCLKEPSLAGSECKRCRFDKCLEGGIPFLLKHFSTGGCTSEAITAEIPQLLGMQQYIFSDS